MMLSTWFHCASWVLDNTSVPFVCDDMLVTCDLTGKKISDALSEMEHLWFVVLHQSERHEPLELRLATSLISENLHCFCGL